MLGKKPILLTLPILIIVVLIFSILFLSGKNTLEAEGLAAPPSLPMDYLYQDDVADLNMMKFGDDVVFPEAGRPSFLDSIIAFKPSSSDSDGDGLIDTVEISLGLNPWKYDSDHDLINDFIEVGDINL